MKTMRKPLSILMAICLIAALLPAAAVPALADTGDLPNWATSVGITGDYATWNDTTLTLTKDVKTRGAIVIPENTTVTIDLAGRTIDRGMSAAANGTSDGCVIKVEGTLTVRDSSDPSKGKITGGYAGSNIYGGGVFVNNGGQFTLQSGAITGNRAAIDGGGVGVESASSSFIMTGGTITDNTVENNQQYSTSGGGVSVVSNGSTFTMVSGTISGNRALSADSYSYGGGVQVNGGAFVMNGGTTDDAGNIILDAGSGATRAQIAAMIQRFCEKVAK